MLDYPKPSAVRRGEPRHHATAPVKRNDVKKRRVVASLGWPAQIWVFGPVSTGSGVVFLRENYLKHALALEPGRSKSPRRHQRPRARVCDASRPPRVHAASV